MSHPSLFATATGATPSAAARTAADVRGLSDEALCALLDAAFWCDVQGQLTEIAQSPEAYAEVVAAHERALLAS